MRCASSGPVWQQAKPLTSSPWQPLGAPTRRPCRRQQGHHSPCTATSQVSTPRGVGANAELSCVCVPLPARSSLHAHSAVQCPSQSQHTSPCHTRMCASANPHTGRCRPCKPEHVQAEACKQSGHAEKLTCVTNSKVWHQVGDEHKQQQACICAAPQEQQPGVASIGQGKGAHTTPRCAIRRLSGTMQPSPGHRTDCSHHQGTTPPLSCC